MKENNEKVVKGKGCSEKGVLWRGRKTTNRVGKGDDLHNLKQQGNEEGSVSNV